MGFLDESFKITQEVVSKELAVPEYYPPEKETLERFVIRKSWEELRSNIDSRIAVSGGPGTMYPTVRILEAMKKYRSWVYDCVNLISDKIASLPFYLYEEVGQPNDQEFNRILDHPLLTLLKKPSGEAGFFPGRLFMKTTVMHLELVGVAFWLILRNQVGQAGQLYSLNPLNFVNMEFGDTTDQLIKSFYFNDPFIKQIQKQYPYSEVVYFRHPHPEMPLLFCSPIQAVAHVTDLDTYMQVYEKDFFQNQARSDFVIIAEEGTSEPEVDRIREGWDAKHRGPGKAFRPAIFSGDLKIQELSMSAKDFEFMALSEWTKAHVLSAYRVPEAMLGQFESFNKASSVAAETAFAKFCIEPRLRLIEDVINTQLLNQFKGTVGEFRFESSFPKDDEWELAKDQGELQMGITTRNEIRKRKGLKPWENSPICDTPMDFEGKPIRGVNPEADKLMDEQMAAMMGPMGAMGGAAPAPGGGPEAGLSTGAAPPMALPSVAPTAQGGMGQLGGRPEGMALQTLMNRSMQGVRPTLATLLNAARGKRGGLAALMGSPDHYDFQSRLGSDRIEPTLMKLLQKGLYDYIEKQLSEEDQLVFKAYENAITQVDSVEEEYQNKIENLLIEKSIEISEITEKMLSDFVTKEPEDDIEIDGLVEEFVELDTPYFMKGFDIGFNMGIDLVEKAAGERYDVDPEEEALKAAGSWLKKSAELKVKSTQRALTRIIKEGIDEGQSADEVADNIKTKFAKMSPGRAMRIARTELGVAMDAGTDASYEKINSDAGEIVVKEAQHWTSLDERVCKDPNDEKNCDKAHGRIVKNYETGEVFYNTVILHPLCRCARKPVLKET